MKDTIEKLEQLIVSPPGSVVKVTTIDADLIREAIAELAEWRACARYDVLMEGPRFQAWDRSQMDRCRKQFIEEK